MHYREILYYERESMPSDKRELNKFLTVYAVIMLVCAIVAIICCLLIGFLVTSDGIVFYIPIYVLSGVLVAMSVVSVVKYIGIKAKFCVYVAEKLKSEYYAIDYQEAKQELIRQKIITEDGFVNTFCGKIDSAVIPFEKVKIDFSALFTCGVLPIEAIVNYNNMSTITVIDNYYYNFLINNTDLISNKKVFALFCDDKEKFVKLLARYNDVAKMEKVI